MQTAAQGGLRLGSRVPKLEPLTVSTIPLRAALVKSVYSHRLCESGVRFVQVNYGDNSANPASINIQRPKHADHARRRSTHRCTNGQLKSKGFLEDTLVWWGGEFGRTPYSEKNGTGRDHNPSGFTVWLAGGGVAAGRTVGRTDEFGHTAIKTRFACMTCMPRCSTLMGMDHERLTFGYGRSAFPLDRRTWSCGEKPDCLTRPHCGTA